jgi:hypothetical protein
MSVSSSSLSTPYPYLSSSFYRRKRRGKGRRVSEGFDGWMDLHQLKSFLP